MGELAMIGHGLLVPEDFCFMLMPTRVQSWTIDLLETLPDDGNKYEIVRGELFVTPPPSPGHEEIAAILRGMLEPYVREQKLGRVYTPRSVIRVPPDNEVEPDLMVRSVLSLGAKWQDQTLPILVVEVLSQTTRRRDFNQKRALYRDLRIPDYWIVDGFERVVRVVSPDHDDRFVSDALVWHPRGAADALTISLPGLFSEALG